MKSAVSTPYQGMRQYRYKNHTFSYVSLSLIHDFHCHSTASDGSLSPAQLAHRAVAHRVSQIALTDHDSVAGLDEMQREIESQGLALTLTSGVEISCAWEGMEIHIVGLNFDVNHPAIKTLLAEQKERRLKRAQGIADKLARCGIDDAYDKAATLAQGGSITRAHFAKAMVNDGVVKSMDTAFKKYLRKGKRAYVNPGWCSIEEAISALHQAGGVAVVAHPTKYRMSWKWIRQLLTCFAEWGGDAVEVAMTQQTPNEKRNLADLAIEFGLSASQGSDFHHPGSWVELGKNLWLPDGVSGVWERWTTPRGE
ncbi:RNase RNM [Corallincola holothuriorum]|nr:PHP domain-containing protein [Corallincola holothuriorum]